GLPSCRRNSSGACLEDPHCGNPRRSSAFPCLFSACSRCFPDSRVVSFGVYDTAKPFVNVIRRLPVGTTLLCLDLEVANGWSDEVEGVALGSYLRLAVYASSSYRMGQGRDFACGG